MEKHLGRHIAYFLPFESRIPHNPAPTAKIYSHLRQTIIHGQGIRITFDTALISQYLQKDFAQCDTGIFNRMVLIDIQITFSLDRKVDCSMSRYLVEHM